MVVDKNLQSIDSIFAAVKAKVGAKHFKSDRSKSSINYIICMLPRTGSSMFCSILEATGLLGCPAEYLNPRGVVQMYAAKYVPSNLREYFDILRRERSTSNGVFGFKATIDQLKPIIDASMVKELLSPVQFIMLDRQDLMLQAVSLVIAMQTGVWHRDQSGAPYKSRLMGEAKFDESSIIQRLRALTRMRANWEGFFALHSIVPVRLAYEELLGDIRGAVSQVANTVGVTLNVDVDISMSATAKLADERSYEWADLMRRKYRAKIA